MKNLKFALPFIALVFMLAQGCGYSSGLTNQFSLYGNQTVVELSEANFKVLQRVTGEATNTYILGIGGVSRRGLVEEAKTNMMDQVQREGRSIAFTNMTIETRTGVGFLTRSYTVIVSADVIEFTN